MDLENLTLDRLVYGGEAMGRVSDPDSQIDGLAVFVPYCLPGETVRARVTTQKRGYARAKSLTLITTSIDRVAPRCPHYQTCGGCHYQHIPYELQLIAKEEILRDQLKRIGKLENPNVQPTVPSDLPWNYRNHVQFHVNGAGRLGFLAPRSKRVVPIEECHLPEALINDTWPRLDLESIPGLDRVAIRIGIENDIMVVLESSDPAPIELKVDLPISIAHQGPGGELILAGDDHILIDVLVVFSVYRQAHFSR